MRGDRSVQWGNRYRIGDIGVPDATTAVWLFEENITSHPLNRKKIRRELAGKDLACWCSLDQPCHADVLLRVTNASR